MKGCLDFIFIPPFKWQQEHKVYKFQKQLIIMKKGLADRIKDSSLYQGLARTGRILYHSPSRLYSPLALVSTLLAGPIACGDGPNGLDRKLSQTASVVNDTDIRYTANFENVASGTRKTLHEGNLIETKTITGPTYTETIPRNLKEQTCFVLESPGVQSDTACVTIPEHQSRVYVTMPRIYSNDTATATIDSIRDPNYEDNPVIPTSVTSLDNVVRANLNGNQIRIVSGDSLGQYSVGINTRTATGVANQFVINHQISPDVIAFSSDNQVYTVNSDETGLVKLTDGASNIIPQWSPDKRQIAFQSSRDGPYSAYVANADGSNQRRLIQTSFRIMSPSWSSDGTELVVAYSDFSTIEGIARVKLDGTGWTSLYERAFSGNPSIIPNFPRFSPDGTKIAFEDFLPYGNYEVVVMGVNGSNRRNFTNNSSIDRQPVWLPDGSGLGYMSTRFSSEFDIVKQDLNGNVTRLTSDLGHELDPAFFPDGRLVFARLNSSQLYIKNLSNAGTIDTIDVVGYARHPAVAPRIR